MWSHVLAFLWCLCSRQRGIILPDLEVTGELLPCDRWVWNSSSCFLPVFWERWSMHHLLLYLSNGVKAQMSKLRRLSLCSPVVFCTVPSLQIPCRWIHWWRCPCSRHLLLQVTPAQVSGLSGSGQAGTAGSLGCWWKLRASCLFSGISPR